MGWVAWELECQNLKIYYLLCILCALVKYNIFMRIRDSDLLFLTFSCLCDILITTPTLLFS